MRETHVILEPEPGVGVELRTWAARDALPHVVVAKGLGGCASPDRLIDELAQHYTVHCFSPRASGLSTGHLTLDHYVGDLMLACAHVEAQTGSKPLGVGHSFGAFAFARALGLRPVVSRVVLMAPLLNIMEQTPSLVAAHLRRHVQHGRVPWSLRLLAGIYNTFIGPTSDGVPGGGAGIAQQRFAPGSMLPFLRSVLDSAPCTQPLTAPALVMLAGKGNTGLRIGTWHSLPPSGAR